MSDDAAIRKAFDVWDKNKDGYISKTEVAEVLAAAGVGAGNIASLTEDVMSKTDLNKDDRISFEEFKTAMASGKLTMKRS